MQFKKIGLLPSMICLFLSVPLIHAAEENRATGIIHDAIVSAGGQDRWQGNGNLVVHETQTRYEDGGTVMVELVHYMSTTNNGYRVELSRSGQNTTYGWNGNEFWATLDGKPGNDDMVREARRVISDAYFRFSLPFILDDNAQHPEYAGTETHDGKATNVVRIAYKQGPADRYFSEIDKGHGHKTEAGHGGGSGGHGHGGEVYNFHFNPENQLTKVHFSHHGDGTYETLLLEDFKVINGIRREHKRTLLRPDGETLYISMFTGIEFVKEVDGSLFSGH